MRVKLVGAAVIGLLGATVLLSSAEAGVGGFYPGGKYCGDVTGTENAYTNHVYKKHVRCRKAKRVIRRTLNGQPDAVGFQCYQHVFRDGTVGTRCDGFDGRSRVYGIPVT